LYLLQTSQAKQKQVQQQSDGSLLAVCLCANTVLSSM